MTRSSSDASGRRCLPVPGRLSGLRGQFLDRLDRGLHLLVAEHHRAEHHFLGELAGLRFDHQHGLFRTRHDQVEVGLFQGAVGRVQQIFAGPIADPRGTDRACERDAGQGQCGRGPQQRRNIRIDIRIDRHDRGHDLGLVLEALGEQRADRAIDQARSQGFLLVRTPFALEEAARDLAGGVGPLLIIHGQGEEVAAGIGLLARDGGHQDHGLGHVDEDGATGLAGDITGLEGDGMVSVLERLLVCHVISRFP